MLHRARATQSHSFHPLTIHSCIRLQTHSHSLIPQAHAIIPLHLPEMSPLGNGWNQYPKKLGSVHFSSVQNGIYMLRKSYMRTTKCLRGGPSLALKIFAMSQEVRTGREGACWNKYRHQSVSAVRYAAIGDPPHPTPFFSFFFPPPPPPPPPCLACSVVEISQKTVPIATTVA